MITSPDSEGFGKQLWNKFLASTSTQQSREAFDRYLADEREKMLTVARTQLLVGNMQIEHVTPQFIHEDAKAGFDTQDYFFRCKWIKPRPQVEKVLRAFLTASKGFYMVGETGCGKSAFAKAFARQIFLDAGESALMDRRFVKFVNFGKMMDGLKANKFENLDYVLREVSTCQNLFLDDIGTEGNKAYTEETLFKILDTRLFARTRDGSPFRTFFTSNYMIADLPYNERMLRRIRDMAVEVIVAPVQKPKPQATNSNDNALDGNPSYS
jgi:DNA replication protein DnaC